LVDLSSSDDYLSGYDNYSLDYHSLEGHLQGLGLTSGQHSNTDYSSTGEYSLAALDIKILGIITIELILHNTHRHITLMSDPLANHLNLLDITDKHTIILMETIHLISILIAGIMMMISLCLIRIQCGNDYISRYLLMYFV